MMLKIFYMFIGASLASYLSLGSKGNRSKRAAEYNMLLNCSFQNPNCSVQTDIIELMNINYIQIEEELKYCEMDLILTIDKVNAHMSLALIAIDIYREQYDNLKKENKRLKSLNPPGYIWLSNLLDYLI
jgi:hypothetical protein